MELFLTLVFATTAVVGPSGVEVERLADNSISPPGILGEFFIEVPPPVPCGDAVLFNGASLADLRLGVYAASSAGVAVIANAGTPVPGSAKTFQEAWQQACAGGRTVFLGDDDISPLSTGRSVYTSTHGNVALLIKEGIVIGGIAVQSFNRLSGNELGVAMVVALLHPSNNQALVIKPFEGEPFIVADRTTVLPGQTEPATIYSQPVLVGSDLVFHARTLGNLGIYRWSEGQGISIVADTLTPVAALGGGTFGIFGGIASLDYGVVFEAGYFGGFGLFVANEGEVQPLILPGHSTVDGHVITSAGLPSGGGSLLSFNARTVAEGREAVFVRTPDGKVRRILGVGDTIEGVLVHRIISGTDRSTVAMRIESFDGRTQVIYRANFATTLEIPTLSRAGIMALVLGLTLIGLWVMRHRERRANH